MQVSELAVSALLGLTAYKCITLKVKTGKLSGARRYAALYAFDKPIAIYYPEGRTVIVTTAGITGTAVVHSVLNKIPGVSITGRGVSLSLNGSPWDGRRATVTLPANVTS